MVQKIVIISNTNNKIHYYYHLSTGICFTILLHSMILISYHKRGEKKPSKPRREGKGPIVYLHGKLTWKG